MNDLLDLHSEVAEALQAGRAVVALESTLIAHGLPWPTNLETARAAEAAVRLEGAVPATIAVWQGRPKIGLNAVELEGLAQGENILKASRRDLGIAVAQGRTAATTVAATMVLAHLAGIPILATGGIGGVHRSNLSKWDVSADLIELSHTPVAVVCAGAKSILDIANTLEMLETLSVPVIGYRTDDFPGFYLPFSGEPVTARANSPKEAAALLRAHWDLGGAGLVLAQPVAGDVALDQRELELALGQAEKEATDRGEHGKALTPFLLARLGEITDGKTLRANQALVIANACLAAQVAIEVKRLH